MNYRIVAAGLIAAAAAAVSTAAWAAESRFPISAPMTITNSGAYFVTGDIRCGSSGTVLVVSGATVTVDLNGHNLYCGPDLSGQPLVAVQDGASLTLTNGRLDGGGDGIAVRPSPSGSRLTVRHVTLDSMAVTGISTSDAAALTIEDSSIVNSIVGVSVTTTNVATMVRIAHDEIRASNCVTIFGAFSSPSGSIEDNVLRGGGVTLQGTARGMNVVGNAISGGSPGIDVGGAGGHRIESNVVAQATSSGIYLFSDNNHVRGNTVSACSGTGIDVASAGNVIDANLVNANIGAGLVFESAASLNVYRNNTVRGNAGGSYTPGTQNTDAGGNN